VNSDRKHKLEITDLKRQLARAKRRINELENVAHIRREAYVNIRDDAFHFCQQWLECLKLFDNTWRSRFVAKEAWFEHCMEVFPKSEADLMSKMHQSRLFENGEVPPIKKPLK